MPLSYVNLNAMSPSQRQGLVGTHAIWYVPDGETWQGTITDVRHSPVPAVRIAFDGGTPIWVGPRVTLNVGHDDTGDPS